MFEFVRKHTKLMMGLMFILIIPSFVMFGVDGYKQFNERGAAVARVAGHDIKAEEWDIAHKNEVQRVLASSPGLDAKLLDSPEARYMTLEKIVRDRVLAAAADKQHIVTSDARLARTLQEDPSIASLRKPDGTLDVERYRLLVGAQGLSPEGFEANVRQELSSRQVVAGLASSSFSAPATADAAFNAFLQKREVQVARFNASDFTASLKPTDEELQAWYKERTASFQSPEQAKIEYIVLDVDAVKKSIAVNEQDLKTYYEQNAARMAAKEERRASHILITAPKTAPAEERQKAKAKADELLAAVRKAPNTFADVAKKNSQDPGSAPNGGDLDFFARGAMVKPFEDAAFSMKKGDIGDVVESDFGYHIIQLTDIRAPKQPTFEELRPKMEADLKAQQAQRKYAESAETFTNGVYEQSDTLKPVAEKLKLDIQTATVSRVPAPGAKGALANPKLLAAIFSTDATEKKRNTEAVEVGPSQLASARITQYTPARTQPLEEVRDRVRAQWIATRSAELAKKQGEEKLAAWKATPASATLPAAIVVSREDSKQQPPKVLEAALRADPSALPALVGVDLGDQGYAVVKVEKIMPAEAAKDDAAKQARSQYAQAWAAAENLAYYNTLKDRLKVRMEVTRPVPKTAAELLQPAK